MPSLLLETIFKHVVECQCVRRDLIDCIEPSTKIRNDQITNAMRKVR